MPEPAIRVEGLAELRRAFQVASKAMEKDLRQALEAAGEPVRADASRFALERISGMRRSNVPWYAMRTGVYRGTVGYVAPVQRGDKSRRGSRKRRNFAPLMLERAMVPALEQNQGRIIDEFEEALSDMAKAWARV
jgi:hypothetical protein